MIRYDFENRKMTIWTAVTFGVAAISAAATVADQGQLFNGIALPLPTRELEWKDVNILSLSDTHGGTIRPCSMAIHSLIRV